MDATLQSYSLVTILLRLKPAHPVACTNTMHRALLYFTTVPQECRILAEAFFTRRGPSEQYSGTERRILEHQNALCSERFTLKPVRKYWIALRTSGCSLAHESERATMSALNVHISKGHIEWI